MSGEESAVETKPCSVCKASKPLLDFAPDRRKRTGRASECHQCGAERRKERYYGEPGFREASLEWNARYRKTERGALVTQRAELRSQLPTAKKQTTRDRLRVRIAAMDRRIGELRAERDQEPAREVA